MLGNVMPFKPHLQEDRFQVYQATYCGLCKTLGKRYGLVSRFALNYDMVFVAFIYDQLHQNAGLYKTESCFANPLKKKQISQVTPGLIYACDMLILLAYYKLLDNLQDEKFLKKLTSFALMPFVYFKFKKAAKLYPKHAKLFARQSHQQTQLEKEGCRDIDLLCMPTQIMTQAILEDCCPPMQNNGDIKKFGFFLGRVIYLLDALKDRQEDLKEGKFNIFNLLNYPQTLAKEDCFMALGEAAKWYSLLPIIENKDILDNIIYLGLARSIQFSDAQPQDKENI